MRKYVALYNNGIKRWNAWLATVINKKIERTSNCYKTQNTDIRHPLCLFVCAWLYVIGLEGKCYKGQQKNTHKPCQVNMEVPVPKHTNSWVLITWTEPTERKNTKNKEALFAAHRTTFAAPGGGKWPQAIPFLYSLFISVHSKCQHKQVFTVSTQHSLQASQSTQSSWAW